MPKRPLDGRHLQIMTGAVDQQAEMTMSIAREKHTDRPSWETIYNQVPVEEKSVSAWYSRGTHYLLVERRIRVWSAMTSRNASAPGRSGGYPAVPSAGLPNLVRARQSCGLSKRAHPLDLTFADHALTGYDISRG